MARLKGDAQKELPAEAAGPSKGHEHVSEGVSCECPFQPDSSKQTAGKAPAEPPRDASSAPAARVVSKEAAPPDQANADSRSLDRALAVPADSTPAQDPRQVTYTGLSTCMMTALWTTRLPFHLPVSGLLRRLSSCISHCAPVIWTRINFQGVETFRTARSSVPSRLDTTASAGRSRQRGCLLGR